ncbi:MAG: hypothetical protein EXR23_01985 [Flavobacteriaceae bacterium]|nr:hypothetical protein [Flavobacteriaceae bacterium]PHX76822.1 MAG: hypothetical protein CK543_05010 [Flavobacteriales bacterium]
MKKQFWIALILLPLLMAMGCNGGFKTSDKGLVYNFLEGDALKKPYGPHHFMLLHHMLIGPKGDTLENSFLSDTLEELPFPLVAKNELLEALMMMGSGSKMEVKISTDSLKQKIGGSPLIGLLESGKEARFIIQVDRVLSAEDYDAYRNQKFLNRIMAENKMIDDFASKNAVKGIADGGWLLDSNKMIKYRIKQKDGVYDIKNRRLENAPSLKVVKAVTFHCEVYNIDGSLLVNSSMEGRLYRAEKVGIDPFESALAIYDVRCLNILPFYLNEGEEGEFLVTSSNGYGNRGRIGVPAYAPLRVVIKSVKAE